MALQKPDIKSMSLQELEDWLRERGEPKFRAGQIFRWLHKKNVASFLEMTDQSAALRGVLVENFYINSIKIKKKLVSKVDGTVKYLYELSDGSCIESVFMSYRHGDSLCISTQVGCRMGCKFCASTLGGLVRGLTPAEMLDQIYTARKDNGRKVAGVVLMGIGEPLDNLDNVLRFLEILSCPDGRHMSLRHVSLSTCGVVDKIDALARLRLPLTLSVSLHAADDERRSALMPVNRKWPIAELMRACRNYFDATGRRVSYEYALVDGENDADADALRLARLIRGQNCHVNLIPVNAVDETPYRRSGAERILRFRQVLEEQGVTATVRRELGADIAAACGQLRLAQAPSATGGAQCPP